MIARDPTLPIRWLAAVVALLTGATAQDTSVPDPESASPGVRPGVPVKLDISRRRLENFLTDEIALTPHLSADGRTRDFHDAFVIGSVSARNAVIWDPRSCRLVGVLDLDGAEAPRNSDPADPEEPSSPYLLRASGPPPFTGASGAFGLPDYFGFRLDQGRPVFLYTHGTLVVEECVWLEDAGLVLKIRYSLRDPSGKIVLTFPEPWISRIETSTGEWTKNVLTVPAESASEIELTVLLDPESNPESEDEE